MWASREYRRLAEAETALHADIQNPETAAKDRAACARVMAAVIDLKRILRMKPKPKDIDVSKQPRRARVAQRNDPARPIFTLAPAPAHEDSPSTGTVTTPPPQAGGAVS